MATATVATTRQPRARQSVRISLRSGWFDGTKSSQFAESVVVASADGPYADCVWIPSSAAEIEAAARGGDLTETSSFDTKAALPQPNHNSDLAVDVAAMTTDGGVLLYGVGEDAHERPTIPQPFSLAGKRERIDQIVQTSIAEAPYIEVRTYETESDPTSGYLLVIVPQSARAPHQVTVGGNLRFYGRGATGNRVLMEGEIARVYDRRQAWEQDREVLLAEAIAAAPFGPQESLAFLHGFARPVAQDQPIWDRAAEQSGSRGSLQQALLFAASQQRTAQDYAPSIQTGQLRWDRIGADSWRLSTSLERDPPAGMAPFALNLAASLEGSGHLFCGRAAEEMPTGGPDPATRRIIFEDIIAGNFAGFLAFMEALYRMGRYHGHVDIGLAVVGLEGGHSDTIDRRHGFYHDGYSEDSYTRTERVAAAELGEPQAVTLRMLSHLFDATAGSDHCNPFEPA